MSGQPERSQVSPPRPRGNRERVIESTIELMNRQGAAVGTGQIAEHCHISPGNLYYHFRNREEILREIFGRLEKDLGYVLQTAPEESIPAERMAGFYSGGARLMWRYRFLFASATEFIYRDPWLAEEYKDFSNRSIGQIGAILETVTRDNPGPFPIDANGCHEIAENKWLLWIAWPRYAELRAGNGSVREADFARGMEQIFRLLAPYLESGYREQTAQAIHRFVQALEPAFLAAG